MAEQKMDNDEIISKFSSMRQEIAGLIGQVNDLEQERTEHSLVVKTLGELNPDRRCFRLIGGVLCERTIKEVLPSVKENEARINRVLEALGNELSKKEQSLQEFKQEHNIIVRGEQTA